MSKYLYYPGCSMEGSGKAYHDSLIPVCEKIGLELQEIDDWNCCGATEYLGINKLPAYALIGRNLALAEQQANGAQDIVAPCSACYLNLTKTDSYMAKKDGMDELINDALSAGGLSYESGQLGIHHLLDVIVYDIGLATIKEKVTRPLTGLRVAPYVGCMAPRYDYAKRWSDSEHPLELDMLIEALGAEVVDYPLKTHCCGGHMPQISPNTAYELIHRLVSYAEEVNTDIMVAICPMCQMNIDAYQHETNQNLGTNHNMPIVFFTQLMGLAFGMRARDLGFGSELVNAKEAMLKIGTDQPKKKTRTLKDKNHLPIPQLLTNSIPENGSNDKEII
ncbi:MAG: CoB--CoM heterodisulfide reductase iron-sulfur subunit B family protein [Anaerolineae bacterium]|jgi:heterodisulfide reductase subunit B2|nr:CoB--CoM heterodisulfide reductase iron-sulfur subunit B family protein [Anaerolineae bacterium]MBT7070604.1 CoB--CoM heterodisulfide reductase iron-sulfur subunit B family protein [Anaerolineae bacterium]MBT7324797.1 CoB--CoM heterodisulfide reductase iron-sulfur subunit B family protein [Anaerolineae bacterium]